MFRTIKFILEGDRDALRKTAELYRQACQICLNYGYYNVTWMKSKIYHGTYRDIRNRIPELPSTLVQTAQCRASEMIKRVKNKKLLIKKALDIRYDRRTFKFFPDRGNLSISTACGRRNFKVRVYDYAKKYINGADFSSGQLYMRNGKFYFNVLCKLDDPQINIGTRVLGIDRGIKYITTCSDNSFIDGNKLRNTRLKHKYLRDKLRHLGTRSSKRKLFNIMGRERRFVTDISHRIAKEIINKPFDVFVVEKVKFNMRKSRGRKHNNRLGGWSYGILLDYIKYKTKELGKLVIEVDPKYTSQKCSKCGYIHTKNRRQGRFKCKQCEFELNADLNAARNIAQLGKSELGRLYADEPIMAPLGRP